MSKLRSGWAKALGFGLVGGLALLLAGDGRVLSQAQNQAQGGVCGGIDPLDVLRGTSAKPNVLFILDTSHNMGQAWDPQELQPQDIIVGGDDPRGMFRQVKDVIKQIVEANRGKANFGLMTYHGDQSQITFAPPCPDKSDFNRDEIVGPLSYVTLDQSGENWWEYFHFDKQGVNFNLYDGLNCPFSLPAFPNGGCVGCDKSSSRPPWPAPKNAYTDADTTCQGGACNTEGGTCSVEVYRSFENDEDNEFDERFPNNCSAIDFNDASKGKCLYFVKSRLFRNNVRFIWDFTEATPAEHDYQVGGKPDQDPKLVYGDAARGGGHTITCPLPPVGLFPQDPNVDGDPTRTDVKRACFQFEKRFKKGAETKFGRDPSDGTSVFTTDSNGITSAITTYYLSGAQFGLKGGTAQCSGAPGVVSEIPVCSDPTKDDKLIALMGPELPVDDTGLPVLKELTDLLVPPNNQPSLGFDADGLPISGVRLGRGVPLPDAMQAAFEYFEASVFPNRAPTLEGLQKNFVILLTMGRDNEKFTHPCTGSGSDQVCQPPDSAKTIAKSMFDNPPAASGITTLPNPDRIETLVVAVTDENLGKLNEIARSGSGNARDAYRFLPKDAGVNPDFSGLAVILGTTVDIATNSGTYSLAEPVTGSVFEFLQDDTATTTVVEGPLFPATRYRKRVNVTYQSTIELPDWEGRLRAFRDGALVDVPAALNSTGKWDAGLTLTEQVSAPMNSGTGAGGGGRYTFAELHAGATIRNIRTSQALIKRRVFTSAGHGTFLRTKDEEFDAGPNGSGTNVVPLWPPTQPTTADEGQSVSPPVLPSDVKTAGFFDEEMGLASMTFNEMRSELSACLASTESGNGPLPSACNEVADPTLAEQTARRESREIILAHLAGARLVVSKQDGRPIRVATGPSTGQLLYEAKAWNLLDTNLASPAIVGPPTRVTPPRHGLEWLLFTAGRRNEKSEGIPEIHKGYGLKSPDFDDGNPETKKEVKPVMTVVYLGANDGLHAFSARTSEELWSFVPYDQLGKLKELVHGQRRDPHTYMIATSLRVADVFFPDSDGFNLDGIAYTGRWRTLLVVGRGAGGKYYTALDVTPVGPFTLGEPGAPTDTRTKVLETNPPWVAWSRGNPDTVDGLLGGTAINTNDTAIYARMGHTWSVPSIGSVNGTPEWRAFTGSGCGASDEGTTFFELDVVTGNVVANHDVGDGTATYFPDNALVAGPAAYNEKFMERPGVSILSEDRVKSVYVPDTHGRIWKFNPSTAGVFTEVKPFKDIGPDQPFGDAVALLRLSNLAHVFAEAGNDNRVKPFPAKTPPFRMFGLKDMVGEADNKTEGIELFKINFPSPFRGIAQPAGAFNAQGAPRVFFVGAKFNPTADQCLGAFDSILFAVAAVSGDAVYEFDSGLSRSTVIAGQRVTGVQIVGGQVVLGESGRVTKPPGPPPPPIGPVEVDAAPSINTLTVRAGSSVCRLVVQ